MTSHRVEAGGLTSSKGGLSVSTLLLLVAALTPGLAVTRSLPKFLFHHDELVLVSDFHDNPGGGTGWASYSNGISTSTLRIAGRPFQDRPSYWLGHLPFWSGPCLACLTLFATALGLRRPRPPLRRLARRPGMAAGVVVLLAMAAKFAESCFKAASTYKLTPIMNWTGLLKGPWLSYWITLPSLAGFAVAASWSTLALGGRWTGASDSRERLARVLGWSWIALAVSSTIGSWCFDLNY